MIAAPPSDAGAPQMSVTSPSAGADNKFVGADAVVNGVTDTVGLAKPVPPAVIPDTLK